MDIQEVWLVINVPFCYRCGASPSPTNSLQAFCGNCGAPRPATGWMMRQVPYANPNQTPMPPPAPFPANNMPPPFVGPMNNAPPVYTGPTRPKGRAARWVMLSVICLILLLVGGFSVWAFLPSPSYAQGKCTITKSRTYSTLEQRTNSNNRRVKNTIWHLDIRYTLQTAAGQKYDDTSLSHALSPWYGFSNPTFNSSRDMRDKQAQYPVGSTHTCWYDSGHPDIAFLEPGEFHALSNYPFLVLAGVLLLLLALYLLYYKLFGRKSA